MEAVVESRQGVHSRSGRRRGQSWQQPLVVAVVSREGVAVVVESRQGSSSSSGSRRRGSRVRRVRE